MRTLWGGEEGLFRMTHIDGTWKETRRGRRRLTSPVLCYVYLCVPACVCKKQKSGNRPRLLFFKWKRKCTKYSGGPPPFLTDWMTSETSGRSLVENRENTQQHTKRHTHSKHTRGSGIFPLLLPGINHGRRLTFPSVWVCVCQWCVCCVCVLWAHRSEGSRHIVYALPIGSQKRKKNAPG